MAAIAESLVRPDRWLLSKRQDCLWLLDGVVVAGLWGISFMHYLLDSRIWKVHDYPLLAEVLGFR